ncbi:MAG: hypothetical protein ACO23V_08125 [Chitinophagaceae bacterium]
MISLSIAAIIITTEILGTIIYLKKKNEPLVGTSENKDELVVLAEKIKSLEDQLSTIRLSISMRRKDG